MLFLLSGRCTDGACDRHPWNIWALAAGMSTLPEGADQSSMIVEGGPSKLSGTA